MADPTERADTAARLRADIDDGHGRDKVAYPDPAAAPLGTDAEAAGYPANAQQVREARTDEWRDDDRPGDAGAVRVPGVDSAHPGAQTAPRIAPAPSSNKGLAVVAILALAALAVLIVVYP